ncbi:hypothetical protein Q7P37_000354 [Cladosporium fusiforme]
MNSVCTRCSLRLQRAAHAEFRSTTRRAFSSAPIQKRGIPTFQETSNSELNDVLASLRSKHFVPGYLDSHQRHLIFGTKNRQYLRDNPQTVEIGDEEIPLTWMYRTTEIPKRQTLIRQALNLMEQSGSDRKAWSNLPGMLVGLTHCGCTPDFKTMEMIVRKAVNAGRVDVILQCLEQSRFTGMTLKRKEVLRNVVWGLHSQAQRDDWSESALRKGLAEARQLSLMLEAEEHGSGKVLARDDPRQRPEIIGVFLELAAANAYKFHDKQDKGGVVSAYVSRLLSCIGEKSQPKSFAPPTVGPVYEMLHGVPIWHGLKLAIQVLGNKTPMAAQANQIVADYEAGLTNLAQAIEAQAPKEGSYGAQALKAWRDCIRE